MMKITPIGIWGGCEAGALAKQADVKSLILTHLPLHGIIEEILDATRIVFNGPTELAVVGKTYEI